MSIIPNSAEPDKLTSITITAHSFLYRMFSDRQTDRIETDVDSKYYRTRTSFNTWLELIFSCDSDGSGPTPTQL
jgi:hypothetical protein